MDPHVNAHLPSEPDIDPGGPLKRRLSQRHRDESVDGPTAKAARTDGPSLPPGPGGLCTAAAASSSTESGGQRIATSQGSAASNGAAESATSRSRHKHRGVSAFSDYEIINKVGEGTFGEVYKARHRASGRPVALKRMNIAMPKEGIPITSTREIELLKRLCHPNVINLLDIAISGEPTDLERWAVYLVFPYMDHDLVGILDYHGLYKFNAVQLKCIIKQLLEGMHYLHKSKVLHRDIKTANILVNSKGELKIADFGLARPCSTSKNHYTPGVVTRWYRPPELLLGASAYTTSIDMWGIGCVIVEILTKRPMFPGESDIHQLDYIFKVCGSPTNDNWPGWTTLPDASKHKNRGYSRRFRERFHWLDRRLLDLLDHIFVLDPSRRLSAASALKHDYFIADPPPCAPSELPLQFPSCHELGKRKRELEKHETSFAPAAAMGPPAQLTPPARAMPRPALSPSQAIPRLNFPTASRQMDHYASSMQPGRRSQHPASSGTFTQTYEVVQRPPFVAGAKGAGGGGIAAATQQQIKKPHGHAATIEEGEVYNTELESGEIPS